METRINWFRKRIDFTKQERSERSELLKDHELKWSKKRRQLYAECREDGGHDFQDLPDNGLNHPNYKMGEWPQACSKCRCGKPIAKLRTRI